MVRAKGPVRSAFLGLLPNVLDYSAIAHWALPVVHHPQFGKKRQDFVRDRRDASRQKGHPKPKKGFVKGHLIAPSIGGGMNINFVPQLRGMNAGEFRKLENPAQKNALENVKSLCFVRAIYNNKSDVPHQLEQCLIPESGHVLYRLHSN